METTLDRREQRTPRVSMHVAVELGLDDYEERFEADAVNLGSGGLSIRSSCLPDVGTRLRCRFDSTPGGTPIASDAEVVWTRLDAEHGGEFGLRFVEMDDCSRGLIEEMLAERAVHSVAGMDAPDAEDATLELGATGTPIQARVARRGRRSARFEQRLDLLSLGRSLLAREQGHRGRHGNISGISLRLEEGTPVLSVNVDFEGELSFGEFEWSAADLDAILDAGADAGGAVAAHDTIPDLQTPGALAEADPADADADAGAHKMQRVTVTEFEASLPYLSEAPTGQARDALVDPPSVAGTLDAVGLVDAQSYPDELSGYGVAEVDDGVGGPVLSVTSTGGTSPGDVEADAPKLQRPREDLDWDDVQDDAPTHRDSLQAAAQADAQGADYVDDADDADDALDTADTAAAPTGAAGVTVTRPSKPLADAVWVRYALSGVAFVARVTEKVRGEIAPVATAWLAKTAQEGGAVVKRNLGIASRLARSRMPTKPRRRTTAGAPPRSTARKKAPIPRGLVLSVLSAGVIALGVFALAPSEVAEVQPLHRAIDAPAAPDAKGAEGVEVISAGAPTSTAAVQPAGAVPKPASVPTTSPYAVDVADPVGTPAAAATATGPVFGDAAAQGRRFALRMTGPVKSLRGVPDAGGFTVHVPGALSLDRAGPIAASHRAVRRSMILNKGDHAELTIRFAPDTTPAYSVRGKGNELEIIIGE